MSPEQLTRQSIRLDPRSDVYSLGVVLYECLTLRRPFEAPTVEALYQAILAKDPPDPRRLNPNLTDDLRIVLETALEKDRDRRYQSAADLAEDLRRVRDHEPIAAKPASSWIKLKRWAQRNPALAGSLGAGFLFLSAGLVVALILLAQRDAALDAKDSALQRYDQMSDVALVEDLKTQAATLWPRRPQMLPAMAKWLEKARELHRRLPLHEAALEELRDRDAPYDAAQRKADAVLRREIHAGLWDAIAAKRKKITETEEELTELRARIVKLMLRISEKDGDQVVARRRRRWEQINDQIAALEGEIFTLQEEVATLELDPRLYERLSWTLSDPTDRWRHQVLSQLVPELRAFEPLIEDVEARHAFAATIERRSIVEHRAAWDRCTADISTNPKYAGSADLKAMKPQTGLVPLGIDRDSGLWEFWHLGSGARPEWEGPQWVSDRSAEPRGKVKIDEASSIVLVLLPGGTFWMGATRKEGGQNYDPTSESDERPVHEVTLDVFFMAKYELTQAQWERLMGDNPSTYRVGAANELGGTITGLHPVTNLHWQQCREAMRRWDLELPTESQWEYACRGGTSSVYWCGDSVASIQDERAGNIADRTASRRRAWACTTEVYDGFVMHAAVGSFAANAFGLHDVLGNGLEWCQDRYGSYDQPSRSGDGLRDEPGSRHRVYRGGSFGAPPIYTRSATRGHYDPSNRLNYLGCRPARSITRP